MRRICTPELWHYWHPKAVWGTSLDGTSTTKGHVKRLQQEHGVDLEDAPLPYIVGAADVMNANRAAESDPGRCSKGCVWWAPLLCRA